MGWSNVRSVCREGIAHWRTNGRSGERYLEEQTFDWGIEVWTSFRSRERAHLTRMLLIEMLLDGLLGLLKVGWSLHVVWYHGWLEWSLGIVKGGPRGDGKERSGLGTAEGVCPWVLGTIHRQGGVVHDRLAVVDWA